MNKARVAVILATFNGAKYLGSLLDSLASQTRRPDLLVVRDDGSSDLTLEIIRGWSEREGILCQMIETGERLGPARSFLQALVAAEPSDIYLFCDQDDVWLPHKIERACGLMVTGEGAPPMLVTSGALKVNDALADPRPMGHPKFLSFSNALFENVVIGCTAALNANLVTLLRRGTPRRAIIMHDWWCYLVATAVGTVIYDPTPTILYRQHENNVIGASKSGFYLFWERLKGFIGSNAGQRSRQLEEFHSLFAGCLDQEQQEQVQALLRTRGSWLVALSVGVTFPVVRQTRLNTLTTRLAILARRY